MLLANALNSVVIILKNKVLFVTIPLFFMVELQNFLNAPRIFPRKNANFGRFEVAFDRPEFDRTQQCSVVN